MAPLKRRRVKWQGRMEIVSSGPMNIWAAQAGQLNGLKTRSGSSNVSYRSRARVTASARRRLSAAKERTDAATQPCAPRITSHM
eukprot:scaffold2462_cov402-Prasinococcus_capsulatus_cf.AAC.17